MKAAYIAALIILSALSGPAVPRAAGPDASSCERHRGNVRLRGTFQNARINFQRDRKGVVAFLGGSITEREGYRPLVMDTLRQRFPETDFEFRNAGISSTCSTTGAFRLSRDVLQDRPPDLLFVEFAVNDDQDAHHSPRECIRGMEGIIRHARVANPAMDIVLLYFVNPSMLEVWRSGEVPLTVAAHREVARRYRISTISVGKELADRIEAGTMTWEQYGGTHPAPAGDRLCAAMVDRFFQKAWDESLEEDEKVAPHELPEVIDEHSYFRGRLLPPGSPRELQGMEVKVPEWQDLPGRCRRRFLGRRLLCAEEPGASAELEFQGRAVGAYVLAGPDAGTVQAIVDGQKRTEVSLYHDFSKNLHYPRTVMFFQELAPGKHTLQIRVLDYSDSRSKGTALRLLSFAVN